MSQPVVPCTDALCLFCSAYINFLKLFAICYDACAEPFGISTLMVNSIIISSCHITIPSILQSSCNIFSMTHSFGIIFNHYMHSFVSLAYFCSHFFVCVICPSATISSCGQNCLFFCYPFTTLFHEAPAAAPNFYFFLNIANQVH